MIEKLKSLPMWFWLILGAIVVATIITIAYHKSTSDKNSAEAKSLLQSEPLKSEIKAEVKQDVFDILSTAHLTLAPTT